MTIAKFVCVRADHSASVDDSTRILVADHDVDVCALLARALRPPFDVTTVHDAQGAFDLLARDEFDLIISDTMLPGTTGLELIRDIRARPRHSAMPILMMTGHRAHVEEYAVAAAADAVLDKPFTLAALRATVRALTAS